MGELPDDPGTLAFVNHVRTARHLDVPLAASMDQLPVDVAAVALAVKLHDDGVARAEADLDAKSSANRTELRGKAGHA